MDYLPMNSNQLVKVAFLKKGLITHCAILLKLRGSEKFFWALMKWKHHQHHWKCNFENHAKMQKKTRFAAASLQSSILSHIANLLHLWNHLIFHDFQSIHKLFVLSFVMIMMKSKALHWENFSFFVGIATTTEFFQDLLWPNMENVKVSFMFTLMAKLLSFSLVFFNILHPAVFGQIFFVLTKMDSISPSFSISI